MRQSDGLGADSAVKVKEIEMACDDDVLLTPEWILSIGGRTSPDEKPTTTFLPVPGVMTGEVPFAYGEDAPNVYRSLFNNWGQPRMTTRGHVRAFLRQRGVPIKAIRKQEPSQN